MEVAEIGHCLRDRVPNFTANKGMDTRRLQHYLGHASITNTVRYPAMSPEPFREIWRQQAGSAILALR